MYPNAYVQFLVHFHGDRDYFECHEILEEYWKQIDPGNKDSIWVGLIQLAVGNYHHRRGNFKGAKKTLGKALGIFLNKKKTLADLGFDKEELIQLLHKQISHVNEQKNYQSLNLPMIDPNLLKMCMELAEMMRLNWRQASDMTNKNIIHKHLLRDRAIVVEERRQALIQKGSDRN